MIQIREMESIEPLAELKRLYIQQTTAPLDDMWLFGFVPAAVHYGFYDDTKLVGYCCVNDEGYLLQFFLISQYRNESSDLLEAMVRLDDPSTLKVNGVFVSTAEPFFLSLCLDTFSTFEVKALMYQEKAPSSMKEQDLVLPLVTIESVQLPKAIEFAKEAIGAPEDWLTGYYAKLISRQELFGLWEENGDLIATGESRSYDDYQTEYAYLGMIVAESERGKGLATQILKQLASMNTSKGLKSICSTDKMNLASQKAISRAGFFAGHRIVQFKVSESQKLPERR